MVKKIIMFFFCPFIVEKRKKQMRMPRIFMLKTVKIGIGLCFILRNHLVLEKELIQLFTSMKIIHTI